MDTSPIEQLLDSIADFHPRGTIWVRTPAGHPRPLRGVALTREHLRAHLMSPGSRVGLGFIAPGTDTCRAALIDIDDHAATLDARAAIDAALDVARRARERGLSPWITTSSGGRGAHVRFFWGAPQDAYSVRACLRDVIAAAGLSEGTQGLPAAQAEIFPKQSRVPENGLGNMAWLPFCGESQPVDETGEIVPIDDVAYDPLPLSAPVPRVERPASPSGAPPTGAAAAAVSAEERERIIAAVRALPNPGRDYELFRNLGFALAYAAQGAEWGRALLHEWARQSPLYDPELTDHKIYDFAASNCPERPITQHWIYAQARAHGWADPAWLADMPEPDNMDSADAACAAPAQATNADLLSLVTAPPAPSAPSFPVCRPSDLVRRPPPRWIVRGVLPAAESVMLYGEPGTGKTFVALSLAFAVARGADWWGRAVRRGRVAYVAAEGSGGLGARVRAYCAAHGVDPAELDDVAVVERAPNLLDPRSVRDLVETIRMSFGGGRPTVDLVVIDTLSRATAGANENSGEDMGAVMQHVQAIHRALGATVLLVHHAGKDLARGARGWSGMKAAVDAELELSIDGGERVLKVSKMKDGEDGARQTFALERVVLGVDDDMQEISSMVARPAGEVARRSAARARSRGEEPAPLGARQRAMLELIAARYDGEYVERVVEDRVRTIHPDETSPTQLRHHRRTYRRAIDGLVTRGRVRIEAGPEGGRVYVVQGHAAGALSDHPAPRAPERTPVVDAGALAGPEDGPFEGPDDGPFEGPDDGAELL